MDLHRTTQHEASKVSASLQLWMCLVSSVGKLYELVECNSARCITLREHLDAWMSGLVGCKLYSYERGVVFEGRGAFLPPAFRAK